METLKGAVIYEMQMGYAPTYRGHEWGKAHYDALHGAALAIELAWALLKWVQVPEAGFRMADATILASQLARGHGLDRLLDHTSRTLGP
jgi:hypothetical protein